MTHQDAYLTTQLQREASHVHVDLPPELVGSKIKVKRINCPLVTYGNWRFQGPAHSLLLSWHLVIVESGNKCHSLLLAMILLNLGNFPSFSFGIYSSTCIFRSYLSWSLASYSRKPSLLSGFLKELSFISHSSSTFWYILVL